MEKLGIDWPLFTLQFVHFVLWQVVVLVLPIWLIVRSRSWRIDGRFDAIERQLAVLLDRTGRPTNG